RPAPDVAGKTIILIDDGLATGATTEAAVTALRQMSPTAVIVAVPVGARETCERLSRLADRVICLATPTPFDAVGPWHEDFSQTTHDEVKRLFRFSCPLNESPRYSDGHGGRADSAAPPN